MHTHVRQGFVILATALLVSTATSAQAETMCVTQCRHAAERQYETCKYEHDRTKRQLGRDMQQTNEQALSNLIGMLAGQSNPQSQMDNNRRFRYQVEDLQDANTALRGCVDQINAEQGRCYEMCLHQ